MRATVSAKAARQSGGRPLQQRRLRDCQVERGEGTGIEMGAAWHLNKAKFAKYGVIVRSSNYTLYGDLSGRVMTVLRTFTPDLEVYSIDEAFLIVAGFDDRLESRCHELRNTVLQWTGIPVSVGIAPTKTLAKAANRVAKKSGSGVWSVMTEREQTDVLAKLALTDLLGYRSADVYQTRKARHRYASQVA